MLALAKRCYGPSSAIPGFDILVEAGRGAEPSLRMIRHSQDRRQPAKIGKTLTRTPSVTASLSDHTITLVRRDFPGWDVYAIKAEYDTWLGETDKPPPDDYQKGFYGFARQFHKSNRS